MAWCGGALACGAPRRRADSTADTVAPLPRRNPFANVPAVSYRVDGAEVDAYFFADPVAAARGITQVIQPDPETTAFTSNNMVVVVCARSAELREQLRRVLTDPEVNGTLSP